ncbi:hypothetical protein SYNGFB01_04780 [Synechococcus sp. GFB01]|nr:hypothetical protein SYNGFB01_04780 [Synechococcus sp. GFB01]
MTGLLEAPFQFLAGCIGHHRILLTMGQQDRKLSWRSGPAWLPARVRIAAAADQTGQCQAVVPGGHVESQGGSLRETQQHRLLQRQFRIQLLQTFQQLEPGRGQLRPVRLLQVIPLASHAGGMRQRGLQGHHAHLGCHQQLTQIEQVGGVCPPAVQQHESTLGPSRAEADQIWAAGHGIRARSA